MLQEIIAASAADSAASAQRLLLVSPLAGEGGFDATGAVESSSHLAPVMNILLLGSGGREHALAWKIAASPLVTKLWCAPGNAGIAQEAECVALDIADHPAVIEFCTNATPSTLSWSAGDAARAPGSSTISPAPASRRSARASRPRQLEGSKGFTKALCTEFNNIPTGAYGRFTDAATRWPMCARRARRSWSRPTGSRPARAWSWR